MKRNVPLLILLFAVIGAGFFWFKSIRAPVKPAEEKPPAEESRISHDEHGRVVIRMDDETQGNMGLVVAKPAVVRLDAELKGYGRVSDPSALAGLVTELASAQAAFTASSNELARLKMLSGQGNASTRALQTVEAAASRDQLLVQSIRDRLSLSWGKAVSNYLDTPEMVQALTTQAAVLVRIDLPAGEPLPAAPGGARITTMSGDSAESEFVGFAPNVDPQTLGQGCIFIYKPNTLRLRPGEAVTGYVKVPGEALIGTLIPKQAVVRSEGAGWVYLLNSGSDSLTRTQVPLDHPVKDGWLVTKNISTNDYLVITGAQTLLSEELKSSLKAD